MLANPSSLIEVTIKDYLEHKELFYSFSKKRSDTEKEYNKLITCYNGEEKTYDLTQADKIYRSYLDMISYEEKLKNAESRFIAAEEKLKEIGRILFEATIHAEISVAINGGAYDIKKVRVRYNDGHVFVD